MLSLTCVVFFQGVSPNAVGAGSAWGLYFFSFNFLKAWLSDRKGVQSLSARYHLLVGSIAGITQPMF